MILRTFFKIFTLAILFLFVSKTTAYASSPIRLERVSLFSRGVYFSSLANRITFWDWMGRTHGEYMVIDNPDKLDKIEASINGAVFIRKLNYNTYQSSSYLKETNGYLHYWYESWPDYAIILQYDNGSNSLIWIEWNTKIMENGNCEYVTPKFIKDLIKDTPKCYWHVVPWQ